MGFIKDIYKEEVTSPVLTDAYHLSTCYAYWREGRADNPAVFYAFGRKEAQGANYTVMGGLEGVIDVIERWQEVGYTEKDAAMIRAMKTPSGKRKYPEEFVQYLLSHKFRFQVDAAPEGSVVFPQEPVFRIYGALGCEKMMESINLGLSNGHSARMSQAARQADVLSEVLDNGSPTGEASVQNLRRGMSLGDAVESSRSLGAGGYTSTSTGTAAKLAAQPWAGTMDHAWVQTHEKELGDIPLAELYKMEAEAKTPEETRAFRRALSKDAFRSFVMAHPEGGILLLDTYDPLQGLENAITVFKEMRALGMNARYGVRYDSDDLVGYSRRSLRRFAEEGFVGGLAPADARGMSDADLLKRSGACHYFCAAADGIDEYTAQEMRQAGAFYEKWGIGTSGTHVPPVGLVQKVSDVYMDVPEPGQEISIGDLTPVMKIAAHAPVKSSNPGFLNSRRFYGAGGKLSHVRVYDEFLGLHSEGKAVNLRDFSDVISGLGGGFTTKDLLVPVFDKDGNNVYKAPQRKESFPGSGEMVTDLAALTRKIRAELDTLPPAVRKVQRPREEVLKKLLLSAFRDAQKKGDATLTLDVAAIEAALPKEAPHIPVYLDMNLYQQRAACEKKHQAKASSGVGEYRERFEGAESPRAQGKKTATRKRGFGK